MKRNSANRKVKSAAGKYLCSLLLLLLLSFVSATAQVTITTPYPAPAQSLTRGLDTSLLTVEVNFLSACTGNTVTISLAPGVSYIPGSVTKTAGNTGFTIADQGGTSSAPQFSINGVTGAGSITFTIKRTAGCGAAASGKDVITVNGSCGSVTENNANVNAYNLLSPALSLTAPATITNAFIGTTASRTTTITNGGNGCLDTLRFYLVYPSGGIVNTNAGNAIDANGSSFTPSSVSGDTLFYKIAGTALFGGNNLLCNGETVTITENIKVVKCNTTTAYGAGWGDNAAACQTATGTGTVTMANGVANLGITFTTPGIQSGAPCTGGVVTVTYTNNGNGGNAGAVYDMTAILGNVTINTPMGRYGFSADDPRLNGAGSVLAYSYAGGNAPNIVSMSQFTSDPDGAGTGLEDLDGDGQFDDLAPGQSFSIVYTRKIILTAACPFDMYSVLASQATYNNMCKTGGLITTSIANSGHGQQWRVLGISKVAPPSVYPNVPFTARICVNGDFSPPNYGATDSLEIQITLPPGVTYTGTSSFNGGGAPQYAVQTGNVLSVRQKWLGTGTSNGFCLSFEMNYDCSGTGDLKLPYTVLYVADRSCNAIYNMSCGDSIVIATHCPIACPTGVANYNAIVQRTTLGWTDKTLTTKVTPASLPALSLKSVTMYDTVNIKEGGRQNGTYNNLYYYFQEDKSGGYDVFNYVGGTFHFKAGGTGPEIVCPLPAPDASASTTSLTKLTFNLGSLLGGACGLPSTVNNADSFWVDMNYVIGTPNNISLYGFLLRTPPSTKAYFYNNDGAGVQQYCDITYPEVYVIGFERPAATDYSHPRNLAGCTSADYSLQDYRLYNKEVSDIFPSEYRPVQLVDSVVVTLPAGVYLDPATPTYITYQNWISTFGNNPVKIAVTPVISGNKLSFINPGNWFTSDIATINFFTNARLVYSVLPSCSVDPANTNMLVTYYTHDYYYSGLRPQTVSSFIRSNAFTYDGTKKPSITVQNNTGTVQGVLSQHYWDVQVNSTGTTTAPYLWIALEKMAGSGIVVDSVVLKPSNTVLPSLSYNSGNTWYKVSAAGLASGASQQARVYFKYTNCTADSVLMRSGWNCTGYPSPDPATGYACTSSDQYLKVIPQNSQVQISVSRQPGNGGTVNMCTEDSVTVIVNSAQAANLIDPNVVIYPPAGITLTTPLPVEYPLGSGSWQNVTPVSIAGGGYRINLSGHSAIGANGLPGTSVNPGAAGRQAKIKVPFTTSCSFVSGSQLDFFVYGMKPCGDPATGDGLDVKTNPINITGANTPGNAAVSMSLSGSSTLNCGNTRTISLSVTEVGTITQAGDSAVYTLPAGLSYAGNFTGCASCTITVTPGSSGSTIVKVAPPAGLASGTTTSFGFDVAASGTGCGNVSLTGQVERTIAGLTCGASTCTNSKVIIGTGTPVTITLTKPSITLTNMKIISGGGNWVPGGSATVAITYQNTGSAAAPANTYIAEFFCGSSTTPFATHTLTQALAISGSATDNVALSIPSVGCNIGDLVTVKVQSVTAGNITQCICAPSSYTYLRALPIKLVKFAATRQQCKTLLNWETANEQNFSHFEVEYSINGSSFTKAGVIAGKGNASGNIYHFGYDQPEGRAWYRLKMLDKDGNITYSDILTIISDCSSQPGISLAPNPAGSFVLVWHVNAGDLIQVYDNTTRLVMSKRAVTVIETVDVSALANGVYMVTVTDKTGNRQTVKLVKQ